MSVNTSPLTVASADGYSKVYIIPRADGTAVVRVHYPTTCDVAEAIVDVRQLLQACGKALDIVYQMEDAADERRYNHLPRIDESVRKAIEAEE